jgi:hypothetical protein
MNIGAAMELLAKQIRQSNDSASRVTWFDQKGCLVGEGEFGLYPLVKIYKPNESEPFAGFSHAEAERLQHLGRTSPSRIENTPVSQGAGLAIAIIWLVAGLLILAELQFFFNGVNSLGQKALINANWLEVFAIIVLAAIPLELAVRGTSVVVRKEDDRSIS